MPRSVASPLLLEWYLVGGEGGESVLGREGQGDRTLSWTKGSERIDFDVDALLLENGNDPRRMKR